MANADVAWVEVLPSARGFLPALQRQTGAAAKTAGASAGREFGSAFGNNSVAAVRAANAQMTAALRKTADAAGQVRVAEAKLKDLRESGKATTSQAVAAEERLATARRKADAANDDLTASTQRVRAAQEQHATALGRNGKQMDDTTRRAGLMTRAFGGVRGAVIGITAGFYALQTAGRFIGSAIQAASDLGEQTNKVKVVFAGAAGQVLAFSETTAKSLGISQRTALTTTGTFGNLFRAIGLNTGASATMSIQLVKTAADLASFNNASPEEVLEAMRAGLVGETEPLRRFGINLSDATMRTELLAQGIALQSGPLTASQKAQAAYSIILKQTTLAQGDFARTSDSLANQQRILSATYDEAKAKLGALLVGPSTAIVHFISSSMIPWFGKLGSTIGQVWALITRREFVSGGWLSEGSPVVTGLIAIHDAGMRVVGFYNQNLAPAVNAATGYFREHVGSLGRFAGVALGVAAAVRAVTIAWSALSFAFSLSPIGRTILLISALATGLVMAYQRSETFRTIIGGAFIAVGNAGSWLWRNALQPAFTSIQSAWTTVSSAVMGAWRQYIQPAWNAVSGAAQALWADLRPVFAFIGQVWRDVMSGVRVVWETILRPTWDAVKTVASSLWKNTLQPIFGFISTAWSVALMVMRDVWNQVLKPVWSLVAAVITALWKVTLGPIFGLIQARWGLMVAAMQLAWKLILHPMWNLFSSVVTLLWRGVLQPIFQLIGGAFRLLGAAMSGTYTGVIRPMFSLFGTVVRGLKGMFDTAVSGIETAWGRLKGIAAKPINFIVRTVLRDGLFTAWNWVLDKLGISSWHVDTKSRWLQGIAGYARGGLIRGHSPTPTADNIPIMATAGEYYLPVKATERLRQTVGAQGLEMLRRGIMPAIGYASGGIISLGRKFQSMGARVSEHPAFGGVTPGAHVPGSQHYLNNAIDVNTRAGTSALEQRELAPMAKIARDLGFYVLWMTKGHFNHLHADGRNGGGGSGFDAGPDPWWERVWGSVTGAYNYIANGLKRVGEVGNSPIGSWLQAMVKKLPGAMWGKVKDQVSALFSMGQQEAAPGGAVTGPGGTVAGVKRVAAQFGWGSGAQWDAINWIIGKESGWKPTAQNPSSSASGLFQHIKSTWRASRRGSATQYGAMREAPVSEQAWAGMNYFRSRYGSPLAAQRYWQRNGHYAGGGPVLPIFHQGGDTRRWRADALALMGPDERVLSAPQDDYFRRFVDAVSDGGGSVGGRNAPLIGTVVQAPGESTDAFVQRLDHKLRVADRGGVHSDSLLGG